MRAPSRFPLAAPLICHQGGRRKFLSLGLARIHPRKSSRNHGNGCPANPAARRGVGLFDRGYSESGVHAVPWTVESETTRGAGVLAAPSAMC